MRPPRVRLIPSIVLALAAACAEQSPTSVRYAEHSRADLGRRAFVNECASCHASGDGFDLAFFGFTDTTIIRRAVAHVDTATAKNIVEYIHTLGAPAVSRDRRMLQPGGIVLDGDEAFGRELFGNDVWPLDLTTAQLRAIDPRTLKVAVPFPVWSDEKSNLDWMPDHPLPQKILDDQNGMGRNALALYQATPTAANLVSAVKALRAAESRVANPSAPCILNDNQRVDLQTCFQIRRWVSALVLQHLLRMPLSDQIDFALTDIWWETGTVPRWSSLGLTDSLPNAHMNWATWQYMGWTFAPHMRPSDYTGSALWDVRLKRHAAFVAARSLVARPRNSPYVYDDIVNATNYAPPAWRFAVASFALRHVLDRLAGGETTAPGKLDIAKVRVGELVASAARVITTDQRAALQKLADQVLATLPKQ